MPKVMNLYARQLSPEYDAIPKAVLAAVAVSFATTGGDYLEDALKNVAEEWRILHENGIVPQAPPARLLKGGA